VSQSTKIRRAPKARPTGNEETFSFGSARPYADKDEYASKELVFAILAIAFEPGQGYEGADRWAVTVKATDRDAAILTLGANPKRDEQLRAAQAHLKRSGKIDGVVLHHSGNAYYFSGKDA